MMMFSTSWSVTWRTTRPGRPVTMLRGGMIVPGVTSDPAPVAEALRRRRSYSSVGSTAPTTRELLPLIEAAGSVADHGSLRPWRMLIPPGVAHGYKVLGNDPGLLVYLTSRKFDGNDEGRIAHDNADLAYDWELQHK